LRFHRLMGTMGMTGMTGMPGMPGMMGMMGTRMLDCCCTIVQICRKYKQVHKQNDHF
jgi:hypothetical protein